MKLFHDLPPMVSPSAKPKLTPEELKARKADWLVSVRLRIEIGRELDERSITDPHAIALALCMPAIEADKLLTRRQWREGDVAALQAVAGRLGLEVVLPDIDLLRRNERAR